MNRMMVLKGNSPAIHKLGDIRRENDDYIRIYDETDNYYIGHFEEGFGFIDVKFNKSDCRPLTADEIASINGKWFAINERPIGRISLDKDGNAVKKIYETVKGTVERATNVDGECKPSVLEGLSVEFDKEVVVGERLRMFTSEGILTTSKVQNIQITDVVYIINTLNSIYYVKISK